MDEPGVLVLTGAGGAVGTCLLDHLALGWPGRLLAIGRARPARLRSEDHFEQVDLSDVAATDLACEHISAGPPVGALVCMAGLDSRVGLCDLDPVAFIHCVRVNCLAHLQLLRAATLSRPVAPAAPPLPIVVISSDVVGQQTPGTLVYAAAKAAAEEAFRHAVADLLSPGVALLLVRLPDIGVPMRATAPGPLPPPRTPDGRPLPILDTAVRAITEFLGTTSSRTEVWHA